jgi:predicted porin
MIRKIAAASILACASSSALAGGSLIAGFIINSDLKETESGFEDVKGDGNGFSLQGSFDITEDLFVYADYYDRDLDLDLDAFGFPGETIGFDLSNTRVGLGYLLPNTAVYVGLNYERYKLGAEGSSQSTNGFGLRLGGRHPLTNALSLTGEAGYVSLDDADGFDFAVGLDYAVTPTVSLIGDYRYLQIGADDSDIENTVKDVRIGVRFNF